MLPRKRHEPDEGSDGSGGFEVRVIGGAKSDPAPDEDPGVEIGLRIGPVRPEAQVLEAAEEGLPVYRLESIGPLRVRPMSTAGPAGPYVPRGSRSSRGMRGWMMGMSVGTCAVVVAVMAAMMAMRKDVPPTVRDEGSAAVEAVAAGDAEKAYFLHHSAEIAAAAEKILERYAAAGSVAEALPLVRDAGRVEARMTELWRPWGTAPAFAETVAPENLIVEDAGRPALVLSGRKGDFTPFEACFVRVDGQLKLDWEASYGIGDVQIAELRAGKAVKDRTVRALVRPGNFYTPEFPEAQFRSFQLLDMSGENFVWAFARLGSPVAELFEKEFNESSVLLEKGRDFRATLKVSGPMGERVSLFLLTEMLHKSWVTP